MPSKNPETTPLDDTYAFENDALLWLKNEIVKKMSRKHYAPVCRYRDHRGFLPTSSAALPATATAALASTPTTSTASPTSPTPTAASFPSPTPRCARFLRLRHGWYFGSRERA